MICPKFFTLKKKSPFLKNVIYLLLFLTVLGLHCDVGLSLVVKREGYSLVLVRGLLIAMAPLVTEHGLQKLQNVCSVVVVPGL